eukprot:gene6302-7024_t
MDNFTFAAPLYTTFFTPAIVKKTGILSNHRILILSYLYLVTSSLSIVGSASIVIASIAKKKVFNREVHPIFQLSLADFFGSLVLLAGAISYHMLRKKAAFSSHCQYLTGFATMFYMNTFLLTLNYAFATNHKVKSRLRLGEGMGGRGYGYINHPGHFNRIGVQNCSAAVLRYGFSWFIPLLITLSMFAIDSGDYGINDNICTSCLPMFHYKNSNCQDLTDPAYAGEPDWYGIYKYMFIGLLTLSIIGSVLFYLHTYYLFRIAQVTRGLILGFISLSASFSMDQYFWLYIFQACTCPLQGFINCIIYGWYRPGFKNAITERSPLLSTTNLQTDM